MFNEHDRFDLQVQFVLYRFLLIYTHKGFKTDHVPQIKYIYMFRLITVGALMNCCPRLTWWHHRMETFSALLALCAGNSPVTGEFLSQRAVTRSFDFFFDLRLNKRLRKQSWGWWFETPSRSLWRHCNECQHRLLSNRQKVLHRNIESTIE